MNPVSISKLKAALSVNIKLRRKELGISQEKLALLSGVDRSYMSEIERQIANPSIEALLRISNALQISASQLLEI
jgi:transcriptional regulator with XRE-family HTH domain